MESIHVLRDLLRAGDWMTKVDLKDAYFMVPIHQEDRAFLKLSFQEKTYQFTCLPFGLACTQWVFTKILKPLAAQLRQLEMRMIVNIDNFLILAGSRNLAREHVISLIYLLENLGFVITKMCPAWETLFPPSLFTYATAVVLSILSRTVMLFLAVPDISQPPLQLFMLPHGENELGRVVLI